MDNKNRGLIGQLTVASDKPYIVYDEVHGLVSEHRLLRATQQAAVRDGAAGWQLVFGCGGLLLGRRGWLVSRRDGLILLR